MEKAFVALWRCCSPSRSRSAPHRRAVGERRPDNGRHPRVGPRWSERQLSTAAAPRCSARPRKRGTRNRRDERRACLVRRERADEPEYLFSDDVVRRRRTRIRTSASPRSGLPGFAFRDVGVIVLTGPSDSGGGSYAASDAGVVDTLPNSKDVTSSATACRSTAWWGPPVRTGPRATVRIDRARLGRFSTPPSSSGWRTRAELGAGPASATGT
jgi:hypothetical protein